MKVGEYYIFDDEDALIENLMDGPFETLSDARGAIPRGYDCMVLRVVGRDYRQVVFTKTSAALRRAWESIPRGLKAKAAK